jgi:energy-coupling factor transporter ATPase
MIELSHVNYAYPIEGREPILAVDDVSLSIDEGEFVAVVGANGSGKSTFARLVDSLLLPQRGQVIVAGLDTRRPENQAAIHAMVGMVFQFPEDQFVSTIVEEDVAFGPENQALPPAEIRQQVEEALRLVDLWEYRQRPPHMLSAGQMQRLALAGVLAMRPRCILFDEATTMLDPSGRKTVMEMVAKLHAAGTTIIYITHHMEEAALASRVICFDRGKVAFDGKPVELFSDASLLSKLGLDLPPAAALAAKLRPILAGLPRDIITSDDFIRALPVYTGTENSAGLDTASQSSDTPPEANQIIEVSGLGYVYLKGTPFARRALQGVSLNIRAGEAHALLGATGSGKSTLLQHLNGLLRPQEGSVRVGPFNFNHRTLDRKQVSQVIGLVFQNPEMQFFERYAGDEVAFGPRLLHIEEPLADRVRWAMETAGLDFIAFKDRPIFTLSGGERRKVALASSLALKPSILLFDEPTAGLDPAARQDLIKKLNSMQASGMTLIMSSHRIEDVAALAGRLTVFSEGQSKLNGPVSEVLANTEKMHSLGLEPTVAAEIAEGLRKRGWPIPARIIHGSQLVESLTRLAVNQGSHG